MAENKKTVLLIEDDIFLRELVGIKLRESKYQIIEASNGQEGLEKLLAQEYDIVLLDIMLPIKTGLEVLEEYKKKKPDTINSKIVIMSNLNEQNYITKALKLGAIDYVIKAHYSPTEMVAKINQLLQ
jgi:two-component system response regulator ResD